MENLAQTHLHLRRLTRIISKCDLPHPLQVQHVVALYHFRGVLLPENWPAIYQAPWLWTGTKARHTPMSRVGGDLQATHRALWTLLVADIPERRNLRRRAGATPLDVNPCSYSLCDK